MRLARSIGLCGLAVAVSGCGSLSLTALHNPLYRDTPHASTITARATDTDKGVSEIRIDVINGELTACDGSGLLPSMTPCRTNASFQSRICTFANIKTTVTCDFPLTLGDRRLISYSTSARNGSGKSASTSLVTYAAGSTIVQAQISTPFFDITLPWETAKPVVWRTENGSGPSNAADKIDVGFFPDADFAGNYLGFTNGMQPIILGSFFNPTDKFAQNYGFWKNIFNLWAGGTGADGEGCSRSFSGNAADVAGITDGEAILHQNAFGDCAAITLGGAGTTQTTLGDAAWAFTHESGHFLHGLGDEYVGGGNGSVSDPDNIYGSQSSCQSSATSLSINSSFCMQIGMTGKWRMDDGNATTMEDRVLTSDWRTASGLALGRRASKCGNGACY